MSETQAKSSVLEATQGRDPSRGRLAVLATFAIAATAVPVPFVPARIINRIRGAIVQDTVARYGLSVTSDARTLLSQTDPQSILRSVTEFITLGLLRFTAVAPAIGPLTGIARFATGLEVFALGHLLERYITEVRPTGTIRIHAEEARQLRDIIDRSVKRALSPSLKPAAALLPAGTEDLRDEFTRWIDTLILTGASVPNYIQRRLEAAFDEISRDSPVHG